MGVLFDDTRETGKMRWTQYKLRGRVIIIGEPEIISEIIGDKIMVRIRRSVLRLPGEEEGVESQTTGTDLERRCSDSDQML